MPKSSDLTSSPVESRESWFSQTHEAERKHFSALHLSSHGLLLQLDIRRAFVAGAWASAIVMAQAVIEATIRDLGTKDYEMKAKQLFKGNPELERIRSLRNELLHPQMPGTPSLIWVLPNGDYSACHAALEGDAKQAIQLMFRAIYKFREA
jgi:hypothetical protein